MIQSWDDATATCGTLGGYLPTISSITDNAMIASFSQVFSLTPYFKGTVSRDFDHLFWFLLYSLKAFTLTASYSFLI
jgi:hypothetical protein